MTLKRKPYDVKIEFRTTTDDWNRVVALVDRDQGEDLTPSVIMRRALRMYLDRVERRGVDAYGSREETPELF